MSKHTRGPWRLVPVGEYETKRSGWIENTDGEPVTEYRGCASHECDISDADAALICAAPDLLDALNELRAAFKQDGVYIEVSTEAERQRLGKAIANADAVVRKAEGKP